MFVCSRHLLLFILCSLIRACPINVRGGDTVLDRKNKWLQLIHGIAQWLESVAVQQQHVANELNSEAE